MNASGAVLIAGCGDVGMRLGALLTARGRKVYALRRRVEGLPPHLHPLPADLTDPASLLSLPDDVTEVVFVPTPGQRDEMAYRGLFLDGLRHLLDALAARAPLRRVVFVSSSAVYGEHAGAWVDEDSPCVPLAFNGVLLLQAEQWLAQHVANAVVARCSGIYGPGRTRLIDQVVNGTAHIAAGAAEYTNRIHVEDVAAALLHLLLLPTPQPCYVLSDDCPATLAEVQIWLAQQLGVPTPATAISSHARAVGNKRLSNRRLRGSGFVLRFPDFHSGYGELLARMPRPEH